MDHNRISEFLTPLKKERLNEKEKHGLCDEFMADAEYTKHLKNIRLRLR
jgi:hypothetical protein